LPAGTNLRGASSLQPRPRSPASSARSHSAAARSNTQAPRMTRSPQRTGNSTRFSSADYPLAARRTSPVAVRAAPRNLSYTIQPFSGPPSTVPANQRRPRSGPPHSSQNGPFWCHPLPAPAVPVSCPVLRSGGAVKTYRHPWCHSHTIFWKLLHSNA
jgi:hypothetical protein